MSFYRYAGKPIVHCEDCGIDMPLEVLMSAAGYYIGRVCSCGPYSREEDRYYKTREEAEFQLETFKALHGIK